MSLIVLYVLVNSFCLQNFGTTDLRSAAINTLFSGLLMFLIIKMDRVSYYGLRKVTNLKGYLYFLPLLLIMSVNLWYGVDLSHTPGQVLFHVITMVNVGFIEEIIFRGMLFRMMEKDNVKSAILVSALTFGIGHIINLLNGADLIPTLLQVCYAVSIGFLFVIIFYKSKSLVPCIVTHGVFNSLSVFHGEGETVSYISAGFLIAAPLVYAVYIARKKIYKTRAAS